MQVSRRVIIGGRPLVPSAFEAHLGICVSGNAALTLGADALTPGPADREAIHAILSQARGQLAECFLSVAGQPDYLILMGPVTQVTPANGQYEVKVRELSAVLETPCVFHVRHKTAREIVAAVEQKCGLHFIVPRGSPYFDERKPVFQSSGTCRTALERVIQQWDLGDVVWYQLPDGIVYFGPWRLGPFTKGDVPIDPRLVLEQNVEKKTLRLPLIPALRPGMIVDCGFRCRIDALDFESDMTRIQYFRL